MPVESAVMPNRAAALIELPQRRHDISFWPKQPAGPENCRASKDFEFIPIELADVKGARWNKPVFVACKSCGHAMKST